MIYLLFAGDYYYPEGGSGDFHSGERFTDDETAIRAVELDMRAQVPSLADKDWCELVTVDYHGKLERVAYWVRPEGWYAEGGDMKRAGWKRRED